MVDVSNQSLASWEDVEEAFSDRAKGTPQRLVQVWAKRIGCASLPVGSGCRVTLRHWPEKEVTDLLWWMAQFSDQMIVDKKPRRIGPPLVVVVAGDDRFFIDGRRRANEILRNPGKWPTYPVLEIHAKCSRSV